MGDKGPRDRVGAKDHVAKKIIKRSETFVRFSGGDKQLYVSGGAGPIPSIDGLVVEGEVVELVHEAGGVLLELEDCLLSPPVRQVPLTQEQCSKQSSKLNYCMCNQSLHKGTRDC